MRIALRIAPAAGVRVAAAYVPFSSLRAFWRGVGVAHGFVDMLAREPSQSSRDASERPDQESTLARWLPGLVLLQLLWGLVRVPGKVINRRAFGWQIDMTVAPDILAVSVVFAIGAAMLAGLYPAWRAGRSQPAIAMREE